MVISNANTHARENIYSSVTGIVKTCDVKPAEFVNIYIEELNLGTLTGGEIFTSEMF